ncbi:MAG: polymer-forming cytoskeletal protein [Chloroflexota bacterium]
MKRTVFLLVLLALLLAGCAPQEGDRVLFSQTGDVVAFGRDVNVTANEVVNGSVVAFGGMVNVQGKVLRDVVAFGGNVSISGEVYGDVVAFGGNVHLQPTAVLHQDLVAFGGEVTREEGAKVRGSTAWPPESVTRVWPTPLPTVPQIKLELPFTTLSTMAVYRGWEAVIGFMLGLIKGILSALVLAALAFLVAALFPGQVQVVKDTAVAQAVPSALVGFATIFLAMVLTIPVMLLTICLLGLGALAMWAVVVIAGLLGITAVGAMAGESILVAFKVSGFTVPVAAMVGVLAISLVLSLVSLVPIVNCVGWLLWLIFITPGLGAAVLSKFGTEQLRVPPGEPSVQPGQ